MIQFTLAISSEEDSKPSTQEVGADYSDQLPAPARISTNNYSSWSSSLQVSWKGEDCGKVNELLLSSDNVSLPQSKSCMDTFLTPPLSLSTLCRSLKTAEKDLVSVVTWTFSYSRAHARMQCKYVYQISNKIGLRRCGHVVLGQKMI